MSSKKFDGWFSAVENKSAEKIIERILAEMRVLKFGKNDIFAVHLGFEEAFINAVKHGNRNDPEKKVTVKYQIDPQKTVISLTDEGQGFVPDSIADPTIGNNIYKIGGRGLFLIRSFMDRVDFNKKGNCICMTKFNSRAASRLKSRKS